MSSQASSNLGLSTWRVRGVALCAGVIVLSLVLGMMMSPWRYEVAAPGPLSSPHAMLSQDCGQCHGIALDAVSSAWKGIANTEERLRQSERCLECHQIGPNPLGAHAWSNAEESRAHLGLSTSEPASRAFSKGVSCATCHREHQGRFVELAKLDDNRCQACHAKPFDDFESGHPPFRTLSQPNDLRLRFDHSTHFDKHFAQASEQDTPDSCLDCHVLHPGGEQMSVRPFEETCASCHQAEISGSTQIDGKGLKVLSLPSIDTYSFEPLGIGVGRWPADADYGEVPLSPFMKLLLSHTATSVADLQIFDSVDPIDLSEAKDTEVIAVARTALRTKGLLQDLAAGGHRALHERLESVLGRELEHQGTAALVGQLPAEVISQALALWLPNLADDPSCHETVLEQRIPVTTETDPVKFNPSDDSTREGWVGFGGWYRQDLDCTIRYRPTGHADSFLRTWIEWSALNYELEPARNLFDQLVEAGAVGQCGKCHQADPKELLEGKGMRWLSLSKQETQRLTRFSHKTHFPVLKDTGCLTCHESTSGIEPSSSGTSSFGKVELQACIQCHSKRGASDSCLTCHNYHSVQPSMVLPKTPLPLGKPKMGLPLIK